MNRRKFLTILGSAGVVSALGGAMDNGLNPTTTLGCGTWGNNIISENLWYTHLMNVSRISYKVPGMYVPTDEEIWAE